MKTLLFARIGACDFLSARACHHCLLSLKRRECDFAFRGLGKHDNLRRSQGGLDGLFH